MKKTIALVTGGYSGEYVISIKTAQTIESPGRFYGVACLNELINCFVKLPDCLLPFLVTGRLAIGGRDALLRQPSRISLCLRTYGEDDRNQQRVRAECGRPNLHPDPRE